MRHGEWVEWSRSEIKAADGDSEKKFRLTKEPIGNYYDCKENMGMVDSSTLILEQGKTISGTCLM